MYTVYILKCADGTLYTGITTDLTRRLAEHNQGLGKGANYTRSRIPVSLVYSREYINRSESSKEEARIKSLTRKEKIDLIEGYKKYLKF